MSAPIGLTPHQLPDPWLMDTRKLMAELARIRELALRVPVTADSYGPTNTVVDAIWDLEERLQYMLQLLMESQREFARKATADPAAVPERHGEIRGRIMDLSCNSWATWNPDLKPPAAAFSHAANACSVARRSAASCWHRAQIELSNGINPVVWLRGPLWMNSPHPDQRKQTQHSRAIGSLLGMGPIPRLGELKWSGAASIDIDVYRNGTLNPTTPNDGSHVDSNDYVGRARYPYEVCEASAQVCCNHANSELTISASSRLTLARQIAPNRTRPKSRRNNKTDRFPKGRG